jgi:Flp pilus assembly pilin Flp
MVLSGKLLTCVRQLVRQEEGPTAAEYAILLCLVVVALIGAITGVSQAMQRVMSAAGDALTLAP